ncbi:hypothetical protein SAMN05443287_101915 [Micromonospora phaseoli]|uniref:Uncharacterized protein n=1 Tax=Micromonospora phaseoli TaxID=1144548 RepID=A0A1H6SYV2_9ACTN|nr:hypothetical protein [Micromonospora phaseoli]PZW04161.1 hypothetical protein CLV64_101915 [Micromonospora phaseoli]GIJ79347.1 hypothetical protein Xph01_37790 [Micromonospora phaseoli]SEI73043.1 hypothetical protein SAMN05443287_101915 [Micromonospora phaseoli]
MTTQSPGNPHLRTSVPRQEERRWWHSVFPPAPAPPVAAPVRVTFRQDVPQPLLVPAKGDAFDFSLHTVYLWTAPNMSFEDLRLRAEALLPWAGGIVRERAVDLAREHEPHRAYDLERALNNLLMHQRWPQDANLPQFGVHLRVRPDERVRERLRPYWEERIKLECDHELHKIRARQADDLTRQWGAVLRSLEDDPVTAHAARLAGERFAEIFHRYVEERRESVPDLVNLLREAVKGHGDLGLGPSEYTQAWDVALRTYERQHGLTERIN